MPLKSGNSQAAISSNISELTHHGSRERGHDQIVAIALSNARRHPRADGGAVVDRALALARQAARQRGGVADEASTTVVGKPKLASGGMATQPQAPYFVRGAARELASDSDHTGGLVNSAGPGRTDIHNVDVPAGSYVLPADIISGVGEGNTMAGANVISKMLNTGPYGIKQPSFRGGKGPPSAPAPFNDMSHAVGFQPPRMTGFAAGGASNEMIPIVIAGGEYVVPPELVKMLGGGDIKRGHDILDQFVLHIRKKTVKTLKKLPGPVK